VTRWLLSLALLTLIYLLVLASYDPWNLLIGALLSAGLLLHYMGFLFVGRSCPLARLPGRVLAFIPFALAAMWDITVGTWTVALIVLHLRPLVRPGIVAIPMEDRTPNGVVVSGLIHTLSPGAYLVDTIGIAGRCSFTSSTPPIPSGHAVATAGSIVAYSSMFFHE